MNEQKSWKSKFLTILTGQSISLIGSSAVQFSLIWWLASETDSPMMMAYAGLMAFIPQVILGPFAGVWVDRLKRKNVVIASDLFIGIAALVFSLFFLLGSPPYWSICVIIGIRAVGGVFHTPAIQAIVPMLVPPEDLIKANGWSQFLQSGAFMLGPVLGAAMYAALPLWIILLTDFLGAIIASFAILIVKIPEIKKDSAIKTHFLRELKDGAKIFVADKRLLILTLAFSASMVFFMPLSSYYPLMTSSYFNATPWHASFVEIMYALGMMLSAIIMSGLGGLRGKLSFSFVGLFGIGFTALACGMLPPSMSVFWIFAVICGLMGASGNVFNIPYIAYLQENIPPEAQGRAFSLIGTLMSLTMPVGLLISGPFAERLGVAPWFFVTGLAVLFVAVVSYFIYMAYQKKNA